MDKNNKAKEYTRLGEKVREKEKTNLYLNGYSVGFGYKEIKFYRPAPARMQPFMPDFSQSLTRDPTHFRPNASMYCRLYRFQVKSRARAQP
jgi:hypothetical protein